MLYAEQLNQVDVHTIMQRECILGKMMCGCCVLRVCTAGLITCAVHTEQLNKVASSPESVQLCCGWVPRRP
jgi:hypothetical protein